MLCEWCHEPLNARRQWYFLPGVIYCSEVCYKHELRFREYYSDYALAEQYTDRQLALTIRIPKRKP